MNINNLKQYITSKILFILAFSLINSGVVAQVTIGSGLRPREGVLLDLKEKDSPTGGVTSTKGIMLPRVALTDIYKLQMSEGEELVGDDLVNHTGLFVFNMKENMCGLTPIEYGVHIWDGIKWNFMGQKNDFSSQVKKYVDQEGRTFNARQFGDAGIWMTDNLLVTHYADDPDNPIPMHVMSSTSEPQFAYASKESNGWNAPSATTHKDGLLYNWPAAARTHNSDDDQGQVAGDIPGPFEIETMEETSPGAKDGKVQGICPNGWHLPTDREWNQLEREVYNHSEKYSRYTEADLPFDPANPTWDRAWETQDGERGSTTALGHGLAMKSPCFAPFIEENLSSGQGGFDGVLPGLVAGRNAITYGDYAYMWTASTENKVSSWYRYYHSGSAKTYRAKSSDYNLFSVRCKKDNLD